MIFRGTSHDVFGHVSWRFRPRHGAAMARSKRLTRCFAEDVPWMQTEAGSKTTNPSRLVSSFKLNQKGQKGRIIGVV